MTTSEDFEFEDPQIEWDRRQAEHEMKMIDQKTWEEMHRSPKISDIAAGRIARPPWLFEDFLLSHSITLVSGEPFAGKTMLLSAMMLSLDSGEPLFGSFQPAPHQSVLFIGQDAPTWDYITQMQKLIRGHGASKTTGSRYLLNQGIDINDPASLSIVEEAIDYFDINVLMFDTLLEIHNLDENSNTEMKRIMGILKYLRDKHHLSIFATTHTAKDFEGKSANYRARGASVIAGSVDQHILIRPHYGENKAKGFYFKVPKSRGGADPTNSQVVRFVVGEQNDQPSLRLEYSGELYSDRQTVITTFLAEKPRQRKEILAALGAKFPAWSPPELSRRTTNSLAYLVQKGVILNPERGIYSLLASEKKPESPQPTGASE